MQPEGLMVLDQRTNLDYPSPSSAALASFAEEDSGAKVIAFFKCSTALFLLASCFRSS